MVHLELLLYECTVCKKIFLSYYEVIDSLDKQFIEDWYNNSLVFKQIKGERKCRKCRKGLQLDMFFDPDLRT
jgi:hypothetical protein